jgi:hypothetical protein
MNSLDKFPISGSVAAGFEPVRAAFEANFSSNGEVGAAVHVILDGKPVVDLWGGAADAAEIRAWKADTLVNLWSTTKGWLALANRLWAPRNGRLDRLCRSAKAVGDGLCDEQNDLWAGPALCETVPRNLWLPGWPFTK